MKRNRWYLSGIIVVLLVLFLGLLLRRFFTPQLVKKTSEETHIPLTVSPIPKTPLIVFHGPRFGADNVPNEYGFWSFAVVEPGKLSRSGQPNSIDFAYLKKAGYKTIISLRYPHEYDEETDDAIIAGDKKNADFNYIRLPIQDGGIPTEAQADTFLQIVKENAGLIHVHCRGGIGRAGVMTALYRFEINGWPMEKAIEESRLFEGGVDDTQRDWLLNWAKTHPQL